MLISWTVCPDGETKLLFSYTRIPLFSEVRKTISAFSVGCTSCSHWASPSFTKAWLIVYFLTHAVHHIPLITVDLHFLPATAPDILSHIKNDPRNGHPGKAAGNQYIFHAFFLKRAIHIPHKKTPAIAGAGNENISRLLWSSPYHP